MRIPSRRILLPLALCLEEVSRWWSHKVLSGCVRFPRKSIHISNFFSASNGRWRYRWDLLDNKFVENNGTRHGGMYSIASFETSILTLHRKKPFMVYKIFQMNYNWNTKEYRMLYCFFYLKYGPVFLHLGSPHLIDRPTATQTAKWKSKNDPNFLSSSDQIFWLFVGLTYSGEDGLIRPPKRKGSFGV